MHVGPAADFPVVGTVAASDKVLVNGCGADTGWCAIRHDGRHGWVGIDNVEITGITRATNKAGESVVVIDLSDQINVPVTVENGRTEPIVAGYSDVPVLRFNPGPYYGPDKYYYSSSSDPYWNGPRYYDRRFGQYYGRPDVRYDPKPAGLVNPITRRYRSYVGPNNRNLRPDLRLNRFFRDANSTRSHDRRKRRRRR